MTDDNPSLVPTRRDLLVGGAALLAAGTAVARMPRRPLMSIGKGQLEKIVPLRVGPWSYETASGLVLPPPDQLARLLYDQQVARSYSAPEDFPVMLLMAYGSSQGGMLQIHRPEICYPASGFRLTETRVADIPIDDGRAIASRSFIAHSDTRTEQVLYWTRIGEMLATSWSGQRLAVIRNNLAGAIPDGLLVRLSTVADDPAQGQATLRRFAKLMLAEIPLASRRMLIGAAAG
ncbi:MAG TPA: EpsI family protein [Sphingomonas sp.]|nr:EpsI family protein [Sphingomonas sp.]